jgi:hypothetical protein
LDGAAIVPHDGCRDGCDAHVHSEHESPVLLLSWAQAVQT